MARYYLVPSEDESEARRKFGCENAPQYLQYISGEVRGITDFYKKTGRKFYVLVVNDKEDLTEFEKQPGVIKLDESFNKSKLQDVIGTKISKNLTQEEIEQRLIEWITGESKKFGDL